MFTSRCAFRLRRLTLAALTLAALPAFAADPGLLFYMSGDKSTTAEVAAPGTAQPTYDSLVTVVPDGAKGGALQCADLQTLAWRAPGNIYAQRGTLSFFWRSRYPVGPTEFPVFRVGFGDHSSWDQTWLRIDYNGHGFDAFVTDASLARVRVSVKLDPFPSPKEWTHLALAWDERGGIRFYVNGKLAAQDTTVAVLNTTLDQFGPHSRIIGPWHVQSDYNYVRGGDIDEIKIYDRMLDDTAVGILAKGDAPAGLAPLPARSLADAATRAEWWQRYGFNRADDAPPYYPGAALTVRKVEIHDAYDIKRWWWRANDGIRETTWPGVYNRSRLPGRNDYFQLPDWDCYVDSGKAITFQLPEEPWNHLEISGAAWGRMELLPAGTDLETAYAAKPEALLFERPKGQEKTIHTFAQPITGRAIRFTNVAQEEPIGELVAYNVTAGTEPAGSTRLAYRLTAASTDTPALAPLATYIAGRFASDERATLVALPAGAAPAAGAAVTGGALPIVHILIPDTWDNLTDGLDGIAIDLPALKVQPTHGALFPLNIQVMDPLWPMRDMLDFTFSVKPGEAKTIWLDLRDRLLPAGKGFWLTIAGAGGDFNAAALEGASVRLVFKPRAAALAEHVADRFTQMKDNYANLVEEHPHSPKLNTWVRFQLDLHDLLRVDPQNELGRLYAAASGEGPRPEFTQPVAPAGVPLWAFRQTELLGYVKRFVEYYIDHRQSEFGDFGGGISDDVDLVNTWPGVALMGCDPEKLKLSQHRLLEAAFKNGMFTRGLPTIQADELHSYEEGIDNLAANMILDYGNPRQIERAMVTARGVESITGVNAAGHRHIITSYYSGRRMALEEPWGYTKPYSYLVCQVPQLLVDFNGSPEPKKYLIELTDGLLAHRRQDAKGRYTLATAVRFSDDQDAVATRGYFPWHMFWGAYEWTGDKRYIAPILDNGVSSLTVVNPNILDRLDLRSTVGARFEAGERARPLETRPADGRPSSNTNRASTNGHVAWQMSGDKTRLEDLYAAQIQQCAQLHYINTLGSLWIDRVDVPYADLQRARLGGVALLRNSLLPGNVVSWKFAAPADDQSVAILVPNATATGFKVIAYNLSTAPVQAAMTGWNIDPGVWEITQGVDTKDADAADRDLVTRDVSFGRSQSLELTLPPRATTVLTLKLKTPGTPYWSRPDLGISSDDVTMNESATELLVTVHSLGSMAAPASTVVVRDSDGRIIATAAVPELAAPVDLVPKTAVVHIPLPSQANLSGASVELDPEHRLEEITTMNNVVRLQQGRSDYP